MTEVAITKVVGKCSVCCGSGDCVGSNVCVGVGVGVGDGIGEDVGLGKSVFFTVKYTVSLS